MGERGNAGGISRREAIKPLVGTLINIRKYSMNQRNGSLMVDLMDVLAVKEGENEFASKI